MVFNNDLIAQNIAKYRKKNKMIQKEMSKRIGISETTLSHIECNVKKSSMKTLLKIAEVFDVSVECLLGGTIAYKEVDVQIDKRKQSHLMFYEELKDTKISEKSKMLSIVNSYIRDVKKIKKTGD